MGIEDTAKGITEKIIKMRSFRDQHYAEFYDHFNVHLIHYFSLRTGFDTERFDANFLNNIGSGMTTVECVLRNYGPAARGLIVTLMEGPE